MENPMEQKLPFEISPPEFGAIMSALNNQVVHSIQALQSLKKQADAHAKAVGVQVPPATNPNAGAADIGSLLGDVKVIPTGVAPSEGSNSDRLGE